MKIINTATLAEETWTGPDGYSPIAGKEVSEALGRISASTDERERHPFDVEIQRIPAGVPAISYHTHTLQWEFYHVLSGTGTVRHDRGVEAISAGDAFIFKPGEAHQITAGADELIMYVIANNPIGDKGERRE
jgi:mannose-6-phosphate isomerase-like protein (cupin superfamily)